MRFSLLKLAEAMNQGGFPALTPPVGKYAPEPLSPAATPLKAPAYRPGPKPGSPQYMKEQYGDMKPGSPGLNRMLAAGQSAQDLRARNATAAANTPEAKAKWLNTREGRDNTNMRSDMIHGAPGYSVLKADAKGNMARPDARTVDPSTDKPMGDAAAQQNWRHHYEKAETAANIASLAAAPFGLYNAGRAIAGRALASQAAGQTARAVAPQIARDTATTIVKGQAKSLADTARRDVVKNTVTTALPAAPPPVAKSTPTAAPVAFKPTTAAAPPPVTKSAPTSVSAAFKPSPAPPMGVKKEAYLHKLAALALRKRVEVLITNNKGHVLVGVNPRHGTAQLPGGGVAGDPVNYAAKKEALEEVGVELDKVRGFGAKPVVRKLVITKKDDAGKVTTWDGHRTYWRTGAYTGSSDRALGADGDAMRDVKFLPIDDAITRLQARKPDGSKDILASARVAALRKLQTMLAGGTKK